MEMLIINCLYLLGIVWAAAAVINAFQRRKRRQPMKNGYSGNGSSNDSGWGGILGGLGLGWLLGSAWQQQQDEATLQDQLNTQQAYMEDSYGVENDWGSQNTGSDWDGGWGDETWGGGSGDWGDDGGWGDSSD